MRKYLTNRRCPLPFRRQPHDGVSILASFSAHVHNYPSAAFMPQIIGIRRTYDLWQKSRGDLYKVRYYVRR